ncbi:MAG: hypothetical protein GQ564_00560 [Bacteroidales bacterium]|nr:hypothetical protein [Bacteroidales bacterium]
MKKDIFLEWKLLTSQFNIDLQEALLQQHHAAQFIAMVGKYLVPQQADDSNTNMLYSLEQELLIGNKLSNGMHIALHLADLKLNIEDENFSSKHEISLKGKTKNQVFNELKQVLEKFDINVTSLVNELHYEIPAHNLDKGLVFNILDMESFRENTFYRINAEIIINDIASDFDSASTVRIWPHHFDTGSYIPLEFDAKNEITKSINIGWAIPDEMINEPYYYLSLWTKNTVVDFNKLPAPDAGEWITTGWNGGILKLSDILKKTSSKSQYDHVKTFFNSGIKILEDNFL